MSTINIREQTPRILPPPARSHGPRPGPAASGMSARDLLKIIRRRKWLIGITLTVVTALTCVGTYLWWTYAPVYRVEAYIQMSPPLNTFMNTNVSGANEQVMDRFKKGQAGLVKSPDVLSAALKDGNLKKTSWYKRFDLADDRPAMKELDRQIEVSAMPETEFIRISMSAAAADDSAKSELADVVNAVAMAFCDQANRQAKEQQDGKVRSLDDERQTSETELRQIREDIAKLQRTSSVPAQRERVDTVTIALQELTRQITQLEVYQSGAEASMTAIQEQKDAGMLASNSQIQQALEMDPMLRQLQTAKISLDSEYEAATARFGPEHRTVKTLEVRIATINKELDRTRTELINTLVAALEEGQRSAWSSYTQQLTDVRERYNASLTAQRELNKGLAEVEMLEKRQSDIETSLIATKDRGKDLRLARDNGMPAYLRQMARVPLTPTWPMWQVMIPAGIMLGLFLGLGMAFLLEFIDTSVKTPTDITRRVDMPLLAMIPHGDDLTEEIPDFRMACLTAPHSMVTEAYRELRTNLLFSGPASQRRSVLVTSPSPDDGRSSVATSLAISIANGGRKVLLVDANFRRPSLRGVFPEAGEAGLSDALSAQTKWEQCVHATKVPNLSVMSSGPLPPNPNELLGGELAKCILAEMCGQFDQVIFDGPPLLLISDASVLAGLVDGVVLVVRAGVNTYGIVQRCRDTLNRLGAHTMGVVLNGVRTTVGGYLRKNYETFYEYHTTKV